MFSRDCPCGSSAAYDACCGPLHRGTAHATSPEQLMRSRFAAYAVGETDYVFRTWHPRTRPDDLTPDPGLTWTRLEVLDATGEEVEFIAHFDSPAGPSDVSRDVRRSGCPDDRIVGRPAGRPTKWL